MLRIATVIALLFPLTLFAQQWTMEMGTGTASLRYMQYGEFKDLFKGPDGAQYILSCHKPDKYWKARNEKLEQCLVSRIDARGNITYTATLNPTPQRPMVRAYNNRFYVYDLEKKPVDSGGHVAYQNTCYVYSDKWLLEQTITIPSFTQFILTDFAVTRGGAIVLLNGTIGSRIYETNLGSLGNWLTFCSTTGVIEHQEYFSGTISSYSYRSPLPGLRVVGDSLFLTLYKPFHRHGGQFDSLLHYSFSPGYRFALTAAEELPPARPGTGTEIALTNGKKIITLDSGYIDRPGLTHLTKRVNKLVLIDKDDTREWTTKLNPYWDMYNLKPLRDGHFAAFINKKFDSTCLSVCDQEGNQHSLRAFPTDLGKHAPEYHRLIDYYEINPGELWLFYELDKKDEPQALCFERIKL